MLEGVYLNLYVHSHKSFFKHILSMGVSGKINARTQTQLTQY